MAKIEEINVNGKKTEVIAFSHTAQEIDDAVDGVGVESETNPGCYYRIVNNVTEWINPPMFPNVEYRTTEKVNGQPVFTKRLEGGVMPTDGTILEVPIAPGVPITTTWIDMVICGNANAINKFPKAETAPSVEITCPYYDNTAAYVLVDNKSKLGGHSIFLHVKYLKAKEALQ